MTDLDGKLTVLEAHDAADCPNRATCWAREIHDRYNGLDLGPIKALAEEYAGMDSGSAQMEADTLRSLVAEVERLRAELADEHETQSYIDEIEVALAERDRRLAAVAEIHRKETSRLRYVVRTFARGVVQGPFCRECDRSWPCPTVRAAGGTEK